MKNILASIRASLANDALRSAREKFEQAATREAHLDAEAHYAESMMEFYGYQVERVDPQLDWWRFAELKQKLQDTADLHLGCVRRAEEAAAASKARQEELNRLENKA